MVDRTHRELSVDDIPCVAGADRAWRGERDAGGLADESGLSKSAALEEVRRYGHVLTPGPPWVRRPQETRDMAQTALSCPPSATSPSSPRRHGCGPCPCTRAGLLFSGTAAPPSSTSGSRRRSPGAATAPAPSAFDTFQTGASYWIAVTEAIDWTAPLAPP